MKKISRIIVTLLALVLLLGALPVFAATAPYKSYTYSMAGKRCILLTHMFRTAL